ncbi:MAG: DUF1841 family protein [Gammaproteobacteria bacterium]|nr:DUF1841 family protein [Gammaproteobacteria bacterium]NNJ72591.1 DUF1841 family protein [Enterobacterales bacterium]
MLFGSDRNQLRQMWIDAWQADKAGHTLIPLHQELVNIIKLHPEYIAVLEDGEAAIGKEYLPEMGETNPFLHMSMHQGIHEQLSSGRPKGIRKVYKALCTKFKDPHEVEHQMIECLAEAIWQAQRSGTPPDETRYLKQLKRLLK